MAGVTTTYKLPWPELSEPANAPGDFQKLATAVEGQAFPSLQMQVVGGYATNPVVGTNGSFTVADYVIPCKGIIGWIDIDVDLMLICPAQNAAGGEVEIRINNAVKRSTRWHNWWRATVLSVTNSVRTPDVNAADLRLQIILHVDENSQPVNLSAAHWGIQAYGTRLTA